MRSMIIAVSLGLAVLASGHNAFAQTAPAGAPAGATGLCKDGSYWTGPTKKGACRGHKGVQDWYAAGSPAPTSTTTTTTTTTAPMTTAAPSAPTAAAPTPPAAPTMPKPTATVAPGGGAGQVWVNTASKVYHCPGTKWYGTTKAGQYMTEQAAIAAGDKADHGKACHA